VRALVMDGIGERSAAEASISQRLVMGLSDALGRSRCVSPLLLSTRLYSLCFLLLFVATGRGSEGCITSAALALAGISWRW
jgi:hypothetical protein